MRVSHKRDVLFRLEADITYTAEGAYSKAVIRGFRKAMGIIRNATDERDIRAFSFLHYHKLKPPRDRQYAVKVSDQFRLILEWEETEGVKTLAIVDIEDYH